MTVPKLSHYQILGVSPNTSFEEIKKSYRKLSLKYHPDKTPDTKHHEKFKEINAAFEIIRDYKDVKKNYTNERASTAASTQTSFSSTFPFRSSSTKEQNSGSSRTYFYTRFSQTFSSTHSPNNPSFFAQESTTKSDYPYFQFYQKSQEQQRHAAEAAARHAERLKEEMAERVRAEAEHIRKESEARARKAEKMAQRAFKTQNEYTKGSGIDDDDPDIVELPSDADTFSQKSHRKKSSSSRNKKKDTDYQSAKEKRRNLEEAAEIANEYMKDSFGLNDDAEQFYRDNRQKNTSNVEKEEFQSSKFDSDQATSQSTRNGKDSEHPIILEEEMSSSENEDESQDEANNSFMNAPDATTDPNSFEENEEVNTRSNKYNADILNENIQFNVKPKTTPRSSTASPIRTSRVNPISFTLSSNQTKTNHVWPQPTAPHKRSKVSSTNLPPSSSRQSAFDMNGFDIKVGDIEDVNFNEIYESLPDDQKRKTRQSNNIQGNSERKFDYINGKLKADILSKPLNKHPVHGHSSTFNTTQLSVFDLHASPKVHNFTAPNPPSINLDPSTITEAKWSEYIESIKDYQSKFLRYKEAIVRYQMERTEKDLLYSNLLDSNMGVYNQCIARDLEVVSQLKDATLAFHQVMSMYALNKKWFGGK